MIPPDERVPGGPGEIEVWGHPWHGLVVNGVLTLPNGATMPYRMPLGDEASVISFHPPNAPGANRTPEQAADDAANGRVWLDHAIISGQWDRQLYGATLGHDRTWLYAAPDGSIWRVRIDEYVTGDFREPWDCQLTLDRFGIIGGQTETHAITAHLSDFNQAFHGHVIDDYFIGRSSGSTPGITLSAYLSIDDVVRDGSRAILCLYLPVSSYNKIYEWVNPIGRRPIGFLELSISGTPGVNASAQLSVLRSREETIGRWFVDETSSIGYAYFTAKWTTNPETGEAEPAGVWSSDSGEETFVMAEYGSISAVANLSRRIVAMGYDSNGTPSEISISCSYNVEASMPLPPNNPTWSVQSGGDAYASITISGPHGAVSINAGYSERSISSYTNFDYSGPVTVETEYAASINGHAFQWDGFSVKEFGGLSPITISAWHGSRISVGPIGWLGVHDAYDMDFNGILSIGDPIKSFVLGIRRYSATLLEPIIGELDTSQPPTIDAYIGWTALGAIGTRGAVVSDQALDDPNIYGSQHPVTGQIARCYPVPVIWV